MTKKAENLNTPLQPSLDIADVIIRCTKEKFLISLKDALSGCVMTVGDSYSNETEWITPDDIEIIAKDIIDGCN